MGMKKSIIGFIAVLALGLLSMGALGLVLYYPAWPVLTLLFPPQASWHGDWVWPAFITVGMGWSFAFLAAGYLDKRLAARGLGAPLRRGIYIAVLWLWNLALWCITLAAQT